MSLMASLCLFINAPTVGFYLSRTIKGNAVDASCDLIIECKYDSVKPFIDASGIELLDLSMTKSIHSKMA